MAKKKNKTLVIEREESAVSKLNSLVPIKYSYFIRWWLSDESEREPYEDLQKRYELPPLKEAQNYLLRKDAQAGLKLWMKAQFTSKFIKLQNKLYEEALKGDTASATTYLKFAESSFYDDVADEMDEALNKLNVPIGDNIE